MSVVINNVNAVIKSLVNKKMMNEWTVFRSVHWLRLCQLP